MLRLEKWKLLLVVMTCVIGGLYALPNVLSASQRAWLSDYLPFFPQKTVNLGLDLRGGSYLLLQADIAAVKAERMQSLVDSARSSLRKANIGYADLRAETEGLSLTLRDPARDRAEAYKILHGLETSAIVTINENGRGTLNLSPAASSEISTQVINQSIEIVRRRIDESGTKEPMIRRQGEDRIAVELPGIDDPAEVKALLGKTAKMSFHLLDENAAADRPSPSGMSVTMRDNPDARLMISKRPVISGDMLVDAQATFERDRPVVSFRFNAIGARKFCQATRENTGKPFAIVLDQSVISAPNINEAICGGQGIISGRFTVKEAADLALLLRAGALPAPLKIVEERSVGPTLGADSVAAGQRACIMALVFVTVLACVVYALFGVFASIALLINMVLMIGIMSALQATLTLPGIAGIVLAIGLAVDANVLVFERIKEELRAGRNPMAAIDIGYTRAKTTIFDSNMSALISALILFSFGTGPIRGFAVTTCVGVITSYFSALMLTRTMVLLWLKRARPKSLSA